jgi:hypothetical protein
MWLRTPRRWKTPSSTRLSLTPSHTTMTRTRGVNAAAAIPHPYVVIYLAGSRHPEVQAKRCPTG